MVESVRPTTLGNPTGAVRRDRPSGSASRTVIVLGAGMAGTGTALALQGRGYDVAIVDRAAPGSEVSYGNAGVIQGEAREPYALPRNPATLWRIACKRDNSVAWDLLGLWHMAPALMSYWRNSLPARHRQVSATYAQLIRRATDDHAPLIAASVSETLIRRAGYRSIFRNAALLDAAAAKAQQMQSDYGIRFRLEDGDALAAAEPALKERLAGAICWEDAWTCNDPGGLVKAFAALFQRRGGDLMNADVLGIEPRRDGWMVRSSAGVLEAAHVVVSLGPWSPKLLERLGYRIPMIAKRGYHMHFAYPAGHSDSEHEGATLRVPLLDAAVGAVYSPMRVGLRIATAADLSHRIGSAMPVQLKRARAAAAEILDFGEPLEASAWSGVRPCMADMLPLVGPAPRHCGLWFNFGHGHQGFTLGPTTGIVLANMMSGAVDPLGQALSPALRFAKS